VATLLGAKNGPRCTSTRLWLGGSKTRRRSALSETIASFTRPKPAKRCATKKRRRSGAVAQERMEARVLLGRAKRLRRGARQQYRLLRQLIAAGNEDDVLDLISSMPPQPLAFPPNASVLWRGTHEW
jgi:hypothetical protein